MPWLQALRAGQDIPQPTERSKNQAITDLKGLGSLVEGTRTPGPMEVMPVGKRLLDVWTAWGAVGDSDEHEIARCILLMRTIMLHGPSEERDRYATLYSNWLYLRSVQPAEYWWQDLHHMIMPCYLDAEDSHGYNPWHNLMANTGGLLGDADQWDEWAGSERQLGRPHLEEFLRKSRSNHRVGGSGSFRRAMELVYIAHHAPQVLTSVIDDWEVAA